MVVFQNWLVSSFWLCLASTLEICRLVEIAILAIYVEGVKEQVFGCAFNVHRPHRSQEFHLLEPAGNRWLPLSPCRVVRHCQGGIPVSWMEAW